MQEICGTLFASLQSELCTDTLACSTCLELIMCCWQGYEVSKEYGLFAPRDLGVFYDNIVMATINLIVYQNQDYDVLLTVEPGAEREA